MNKKNILLVTIVVLIAAAAIIIVRFSTPEDTWICENNQWVKHGNPSAPAPQTGCGEQQNTDNKTQTNFSKAGYITNFDTRTGKETQAWYFLYEEPGAPALSKLLVVLPNCKYYYLNGNTATCMDVGGDFYNGQRVKIDGQLTDNALNAVRIYEQAAAETNAQIANPASVYCQEQGGTLEIREVEGGQIGWCIFPDGRECEEWDFFRSQTCAQAQGN